VTTQVSSFRDPADILARLDLDELLVGASSADIRARYEFTV
jgi:hypothetical protein